MRPLAIDACWTGNDRVTIPIRRIGRSGTSAG